MPEHFVKNPDSVFYTERSRTLLPSRHYVKSVQADYTHILTESLRPSSVSRRGFINNPFADAICAKLQQNNIMTVARRSVDGQELLYHSIKYTNNIFVLSELKIHQASTALTVSVLDWLHHMR